MVTSRPYGVPTGGWKPYSGMEAGSRALKRGREEETDEEGLPDFAECLLLTMMCPHFTVRIAGLEETMLRTARDSSLHASGRPRITVQIA